MTMTNLLLLVTVDNKRRILKSKKVLTHSFIHTRLIFLQITGMADSQATDRSTGTVILVLCKQGLH